MINRIYHFEEQSVSFDYDDTLTNDSIQVIAKKYIDEGVPVHIITRRRKSQSGPVYNIASELGIPKNRVHFTEGKLKWSTIKKVGVRKHYDNNQNEIDNINRLTKAKGVKV